MKDKSMNIVEFAKRLPKASKSNAKETIIINPDDATFEVKRESGNSKSVDYRIKEVLNKSGFTLSSFATAKGIFVQSFCRKVNHGKFTVDELAELSEIIGCKFQCGFVLPNGERITIYDSFSERS